MPNWDKRANKGGLSTLEPEYCDDCGELCGHYDPTLAPGEKIIITRACECVRRANKKGDSQ